MTKINRREFVKASVITTIGAALPQRISLQQHRPFQFAQSEVTYDYAALEPSIDTMTMDIHYNKHHAAYVKKCERCHCRWKHCLCYSEAEFFANTSKLSAKARNNGGGVWNHNFFGKWWSPAVPHRRAK